MWLRMQLLHMYMCSYMPTYIFSPSNLLLPSSAAPHTPCMCLIPPSGYLRWYFVADVKHGTHVSTISFSIKYYITPFFHFFFYSTPFSRVWSRLVFHIFHVTITLSCTQHFLCHCLAVCHIKT